MEMLLLGEDATVPTAIDALPLIGLDISPTQMFTAYCEGAWRFRTLLKQGTPVYSNQGLNIAAGVRIHFNF
jgi:hypothetical protein